MAGGGVGTPNVAPSAAKQWTWVSGSNTVPGQYNGQPGVYGTLGTPSPSNVPGGRQGSVSWTDLSGNLWLFGGLANTNSGSGDFFNDLWEFNPTNKEWTWVSGANTADAPGVYGTMGTPAVNNVPGGRNGSVSWTDHNGNLWLFGGDGYDSTGTLSYLNDLWEFNPTSKEWTWVSGSNIVGGSGVYGTLGTPSPSNIPGSRMNSVSWTDGSGNLWLFGGSGLDSTDTLGDLNDLWEFNPTTKEWTWVSGSNIVGPNLGQFGIYGTLGVPSPNNVPGGRFGSVSWTDSSGNFWLFGGVGPCPVGMPSMLEFNDLWEFNPTNKEWTWVSGSGSGTADAPGIYGTLGVPNPNNVPGVRWSAVSWIDSSGNLWLSGGETGIYLQSASPCSPLFSITAGANAPDDLWEFNPTNKEWTWMGGDSAMDTNSLNQPGIYGTPGIPAAANIPGARDSAVSWTDSSGNLWLFGGQGYDSTGTYGNLNDLWRYQP